jgi:Fe-S oxidoreductase
VILGATLRLVPSPPARTLLVLGYPSVYEAGDHVPEIVRFGPIGLEGIDDRLIQDMKAIKLHPQNLKLLPDGGGWLIAEFGGETREESDAAARRAMEALKKTPKPPSMKLYDDPREEKLIWKVRESGLGATAHVPNKKITWEGWEDSAVPIERLGEYLRKLRALFEQYCYDCDLYGHFGQGCVHTRIDFDLETAEGIRTFGEFLHDAARLVVSLGGSISGEHGDGQSKAELLPIMFGDELMAAFREFKRIWDPEGRMNPGKVVDAFRPDENLRLGARFNPAVPETHFRFPEDRGDFSRTVLRCVGVGECRKHGGTMCPSYMATGEEMHSTRGRARLLFEMMRGEALSGGWKSDAVRESLDLCLSCKGCKGECPVSVDMASYKAEFMAHHYEGRPRPRSAYAFGLVDRWARMASAAPGLVNWLARTPPFVDIARALAGMPKERAIPGFARQTFRDWFGKRPRRGGGAKAILWADTFNNYFHPDTARAALAVLERAGVDVRVPGRHLCCGRPLYEFGFLDRARRYLTEIMDALADEIDAGVPIVVLEPACASVFRDELLNLFPRNERAKRLAAQTFLLTEFLEKRVDGWAPPALRKKALVHAHCHHKSVLGTDAEEAVLAKLGLDFTVLDSGCCGMAGSFGFDERKYPVSIAAGERVLLPAVRAAAADTLIVAEGFSCREQIAQCTGRRALHPAEVIAMAF